MKKNVLLLFLLFITVIADAQILGGGATFSSAVLFNQAWLTNCPSSSQNLSNQLLYEPTEAMDACAPAPACAATAGSTIAGSDVWYSFYAQSTTASIVVNPTSAFDIVIQAFSGTACPGLTTIGCANVAGTNATETLNLTGLTVNQLYYFRIFGYGNTTGKRTGPYTFCGTTQVGSAVLPVELSSLNATAKNDKVELNWTVESALNNSYFEIERSNDASKYTVIGKVAGAGTTAQTVQYSFTDVAPAASTNFYRLKLVDNNGNFKYSAVVTARLDGKIKNALQVYPNPVTDKINLKIAAAAAVNSTIKIFNNAGGIVYEKNKKLVKGENIIVINRGNDLARGLYFLQINTNNEILNTTLISMQ
jgi:hypothetical protein